MRVSCGKHLLALCQKGLKMLDKVHFVQFRRLVVDFFKAI